MSASDILVGVPCYKDGPMIARCLASIVSDPGVRLLAVDNGGDEDVKRSIHAVNGFLISNETNRYVNPAWNQIMSWFLSCNGYDLLVLANSDLVLDPGWADKLRAHRCVHTAEQVIYGFDRPRNRRTTGEFFALTRRAVEASYPIPDDLLVMGGDDFIFHVSRGMGYEEHVIEDLTMSHVERGTYDQSPEVWEIARRDTDAWYARVLPVLVPRRILRRS